MVRVLTKREFIAKAIKIYGDNGEYSKVYYENNNTEVYIICPSHSEFWQLPRIHLQQKSGCPVCGGSKL